MSSVSGPLSLSNTSDSVVSIDAAPSAALAHSSSTQLISGTLVIQSAPSAVASPSNSSSLLSPALGSSAPSGVPLRRGHAAHEAYKGDAVPASSSTTNGAAASTIGSGEHFSADNRAARRAAKGQSRDELKQAFSVFDTDGSGSITTAEFGVVFKMLGMNVSDTELNAMIAELDEDSDGEISFDEFVAMMTRRAAADMNDGLDPIEDALQVFDTSDPAITKMSVKELQHICQLLKENLTDEEMDSILKEMQPDAEGFINYAKLVSQMMPGN